LRFEIDDKIPFNIISSAKLTKQHQQQILSGAVKIVRLECNFIIEERENLHLFDTGGMRWDFNRIFSYIHVGGNVHRHHINWRQSYRTQLSFFFVDGCKFATFFFSTSFHDVLAPNFTTSPLIWCRWDDDDVVERDKMSRNKSNSNQNY
jgi:hypothetical protein